MSFKRRSVDLLPDEFEAVIELLQARAASGASERDREYHGALARKVAATPSFDNPIVMGAKDLHGIVSSAVSKFIELPADLYLSQNKLTHEEITKLALASSLIMWLNGQSNLRRIVDFDFTDCSSQYESLEDI